ncbi:hypothetical protein [Flavobacterium sp. KBS0721]|uniref:hypothetical protein n=1 Tax=Flavobacterium sp. KBS0721 TaxID=1179672 RepID=UPI00098FA92C|nr:hypothetical protein [Flavobacterium sp. KBS0721]QDW21853.1 hypothetical protein B0M43_0017605 [Flavobacterium sp. KBS0721]
MIIECYQLLKEIEKRPAMWTGEVNLKSIKLFVSGYYQALIDNKIVPENIDEPFFDWVANKLGYFESTAGWANMILAYTLGFEPQSIIWEEVFDYNVTKEQHLRSVQQFYELVEQFKSELQSNLN